MDKLIVTIISIALTAAVLYGASDHLTAFYTTAHARSKAQTWIAEAAQIATAAKNSGTLASGSDNWAAGTAASLVSIYLSALPRHSGSYVFLPAYASAAAVTTFPRNNTDATIIFTNAVESGAVCQEIQKLGNRGTSTPASVTSVTATTINYTIAKNSAQPFACAWHDVNGNGAQDATGTDTYYFLYRVFLDRGTY